MLRAALPDQIFPQQVHAGSFAASQKGILHSPQGAKLSLASHVKRERKAAAGGMSMEFLGFKLSSVSIPINHVHFGSKMRRIKRQRRISVLLCLVRRLANFFVAMAWTRNTSTPFDFCFPSDLGFPHHNCFSCPLILQSQMPWTRTRAGLCDAMTCMRQMRPWRKCVVVRSTEICVRLTLLTKVPVCLQLASIGAMFIKCEASHILLKVCMCLVQHSVLVL